MNVKKQEAKLLKTMIKADECHNREQARKLIRKADKVTKKLSDVWPLMLVFNTSYRISMYLKHLC